MDLGPDVLDRQLAGSKLRQPSRQRYPGIPRRLVRPPGLDPGDHQQGQLQPIPAAIADQAPDPFPAHTRHRLGGRGHQLGRQFGDGRGRRCIRRRLDPGDWLIGCIDRETLRRGAVPWSLDRGPVPFWLWFRIGSKRRRRHQGNAWMSVVPGRHPRPSSSLMSFPQ